MKNPGADPAWEEALGRPDLTDITHLIIDDLGKDGRNERGWATKSSGHQAQSYSDRAVSLEQPTGTMPTGSGGKAVFIIFLWKTRTSRLFQLLRPM